MYEALITQINNYVRANAHNEITGDGLNVILQSMLSALGMGMRFYGVATEQISPAQNQYPKFYIAFEPGEYSNFSIQNVAKFSSGFAIIYDSLGNNEWYIAVKNITVPAQTFLIDAKVIDSVYSSSDLFYVKEVIKDNNSSTFTIYKTDENNMSEALVATFSSAGILSGYKTHEIQDVNGVTSYVVSVNWDDVASGETVEYVYSDSCFPKTAYVKTPVDTTTEEQIAVLKKRLSAVEGLQGWLLNDNATTYSKNAAIFAKEYVDGVMTPTFTSQVQLPDANAYELTNILEYYMPAAGAPSSATTFTLNLLPANFPTAGNEYIILLQNNARVDCDVDVVTPETTTNVVFYAKSFLVIKVLKIDTAIYWSSETYKQ